MTPLHLLDRAESLLRAGRPEEALPLLSRALAGDGDRFFRADLFLRRAEALRALSRFEEALSDYWKAHKLYRLCGVPSERLRTLLGASACLRVLSRYTQADRMWRSVARLLPKAAAPLSDDIRLETALILRGLGKTRDAVRALRRLIPRLQKREDREALQHAWWALAGAERFSGSYGAALAAFGKSAALARRNGDLAGMAYAWCGEAGCLRILGRGKASFGEYRRAHAFFRRTKDYFGEAYGLCGMGNALRALGDPRGTLDLYHRSAALYEKVGDAGSKAFAFWGLGGSLRRLGRLPESLGHYRRALALFQRVKDPRGVIMAMLGLGRTEGEAGRSRTAGVWLERAARVARKEKHPYEEALARLEMERVAGRALNAGRFKTFGISAAAVRAWKDLP